MMSEQIQARLDDQQRTFKVVEDQLSSNLRKKEEECKTVRNRIRSLLATCLLLSPVSRRA